MSATRQPQVVDEEQQVYYSDNSQEDPDFDETLVSEDEESEEYEVDEHGIPVEMKGFIVPDDELDEPEYTPVKIPVRPYKTVERTTYYKPAMPKKKTEPATKATTEVPKKKAFTASKPKQIPLRSSPKQ